MCGRKPSDLLELSHRPALAHERDISGAHVLHIGPFFVSYLSKSAQLQFFTPSTPLPTIGDTLRLGRYTWDYLKAVFSDFADYAQFLTTRPQLPPSASLMTAHRWLEVVGVLAGIAEGRDLLRRFSDELEASNV
jgi:hypothetical protein